MPPIATARRAPPGPSRPHPAHRRWPAARRCGSLLALLLTIAASACSLTFDGSEAGVALLGEPIPPTAFPKLNGDAPIRDLLIMAGVDGASWAVLMEVPPAPLVPSPSPPPHDRARLVSLEQSGSDVYLDATHITIGDHTLFGLQQASLPGQSNSLTLLQPGDGGLGRHFDLPGGDSILITSPHDAAFAYVSSETMPPSILVARSDGSFRRQLPLPAGLTPATLASQLRMFFSPDAALLLVQTADGKLAAHSTTDLRDLALGDKPVDKALGFDSRQQALLSCGDRGLIRVLLDGSAVLTLDTAPCIPAAIYARNGQVTYKRAEGLYRVSELGGPTQQLIAPPIEQLLALGPSGELAYSQDPPLLYGSGIGDGWLNGWRFMRRGKRVAWSLDGQRLHWLENAARSDGSGELSVAAIGQDGAQLLARNVRQYSEVSSGRLLAISNADGKGVYNRLILIDEATATARWVVDSARLYLRIPGTQELLVEIVNGDLGYDIRRVPIPQ